MITWSVEELIFLLFAFGVIKISWDHVHQKANCVQFAKRGYNPVSWFIREFQWTTFNKSRFQFYKELYDELAAYPYAAYYANFFESKFLIMDPHLIELVNTKEFEHFASRPRSTYLENDHLTHSIFNLDGEHWKKKRHCLSSAFSDGKFEHMFVLINECAEDMKKMLLERVSKNHLVDMNEIARTYVMTVIRYCVFGQESFDRADANSPFAKMAKLLRNTNSSRFKFFDILSCVVPSWRHVFGASITHSEASEYFKTFIRDIIEQRKLSNQIRGTFLDSYIEMENCSRSSEELFKWDLKATEAHLIVFLLGGFTATSSAIAFTLYEIAKNEEIQKKLVKEIYKLLKNSNANFTIKGLKDMTYLDQVVSESLRKYPPFAVNVRNCSKEFKMPDGQIIDEGKTLIIPVCGIHHNPRYYPQPDIFNPDRFSEEEKNKRPRFSYLPFGEGPRKCIGQRFAVLIMKTMIVKLLSEFQLSLTHGYQLSQFLPWKFTTTVSEVKLQCHFRVRRSSNE